MDPKIVSRQVLPLLFGHYCNRPHEPPASQIGPIFAGNIVQAEGGGNGKEKTCCSWDINCRGLRHPSMEQWKQKASF